ncbi:MAG: DUF5947 family protein [Solirubrobacteraceae bacterium]
MSGGGRDQAGRRTIDGAVASRRRASAVAGLRGLAQPRRSSGEATPAAPDGERCDLCGIGIASDHRHLLALAERRIICSCEACWAMRAGEGDYRPTGNRTLWLAELDVPDELWASFQIPIGLAFFMYSTVTACVVGMYPSPGGATESELHFESWQGLLDRNPVLQGLEPDIEGLIANRLSDPAEYAIAPIDRCYALTGTIKAHWEGISGGPGVEAAVAGFFEQLRAEAIPA